MKLKWFTKNNAVKVYNNLVLDMKPLIRFFFDILISQQICSSLWHGEVSDIEYSVAKV